MTIHAAMIYSDSDRIGFLLGSDTNAAYKIVGTDVKSGPFHVDKSIRGRKTIAFIRGVIPGLLDNPIGSFNEVTSSLENVFDDVEENTDYSHLQILTEASTCAFLIGKRTDDALELYTLSNSRDTNPNTANLIHRIQPQSKPNGTLFWYAANSNNYYFFRGDKVVNFNQAFHRMRLLLQPPSELLTIVGLEPSYQPGNPTIYRLGFDGIERISE